MSAKVREGINLVNIYIKRRVTGRKIPTHIPAKSSAVGSTSHRKTWGKWSRKNLMKACLRYRSIRACVGQLKRCLHRQG